MLIKTENLTFCYPSSIKEEAILKNINLTINKGEILGIIGKTGSGKSTFLQHLNGLLKPTSGKIFFKGKNIWENKKIINSIKFKIGIVFQYPEHQLFEDTIYKDIAFGPKNMNLKEEEVRKRVEKSSNFVGISKKTLNKSPFEISGGEKRKAVIAGVIAMDPDVLILDEFTAGLDPISRNELINNILLYHKKRKNTIIFTSHDMDEIAKIADRILVFEKGEILMFDETIKVFFKHKELEKIGLSVPKITSIINSLRKMGHNHLPECVLTKEEAVNCLM